MMETLLDREDSIFNPPQLGCVLSLTGLPGGDGKIYDRSPYGNVGTIIGATWKRLPSGLWCLSFDGSDDETDVGTMGSMGSDMDTKPITIETWVNIVSGTTQTCAVVGTLNDGSNTFLALRINLKSDETAETGGLALGARDEDAILLRAGVDSDTGIADGNWHHLAVCLVDIFHAVEANRIVKFYLDAILLTTTYTSRGRVDNTANFQYSVLVGASNGRGTPADFLKGGLALTKIYVNTELTLSEIQSHRNQEKHLFGVW